MDVPRIPVDFSKFNNTNVYRMQKNSYTYDKNASENSNVALQI